MAFSILSLNRISGSNGLYLNISSKIRILLPVVFVVVCGYLLFKPLDLENLVSHPRPARSYDEAVARIEGLRLLEPQDTNPACRSQFLTHGRKAEQVIVFVHGYTNCPQQFLPLGQMFFNLGYNVLIRPLPHHGLSDRMTAQHALLTAEELAAYADEVVDIARGLGEKVVMAGISAGGVTTAYAAQFRSDIDLAVLISPALGFRRIPENLTAPAVNVFLSMPNYFDWWDGSRKRDGTPAHAYPRYSTRALAHILRLGSAVQAAGKVRRPAAGVIAIITNANDRDVNKESVRTLLGNWAMHQAAVRTYELSADLNLAHDFIDAAQAGQRTDMVYPTLLQIITTLTSVQSGPAVDLQQPPRSISLKWPLSEEYRPFFFSAILIPCSQRPSSNSKVSLKYNHDDQSSRRKTGHTIYSCERSEARFRILFQCS